MASGFGREAHDPTKGGANSGASGDHPGDAGGNYSTPGGPTINRNPTRKNMPRPGTGDMFGVTAGAPVSQTLNETNYNNASWSQQHPSIGESIANHLKNMIPGMHQWTANAGIPSTYAGGMYHDAWSPVGAAGAIAGAMVPGGSFIGGKIGQGVSNLTGAPEYGFGGGGWQGAPNSDFGGFGQGPASPGAPGAPGSLGQGPQYAGGNGTNASNPLSGAFGHTSIASAPGGASFGAQPVVGAPGAFPGGVPNHSLPQGYESMFPNSLTSQDKALLYAKALGGTA